MGGLWHCFTHSTPIMTFLQRFSGCSFSQLRWGHWLSPLDHQPRWRSQQGHPAAQGRGKLGSAFQKKMAGCVCFWHLLKMIVFELFLETWFKLNCLENDDPTTMGPENDTAWKCNEVPWGSMRRMRFLCQLYKFQDVLRGRRQSCCKSCQERFSAQE